MSAKSAEIHMSAKIAEIEFSKLNASEQSQGSPNQAGAKVSHFQKKIGDSILGSESNGFVQSIWKTVIVGIYTAKDSS